MAMRLFMVGASPYARKVLAAAVEHGVADRIERVYANPHHIPPELVAQNPLSKVPTLVLEDGSVLFDSTAICLYLDAIGSGPKLLPDAQPLRWTVLRRHGLAHGILDAAVTRRVEGWRAQEPDRIAAIAKQQEICRRALDALEREVGDFGAAFTLDLLTLGCALGFLDFRFPTDAWREGRPRLANWYEGVARRPSLTQTMPHD